MGRKRPIVTVELAKVDEVRLVLVSWPLSKNERPPLTTAEQEILRLIVSGATNAVIARQRRTSPRTIANQIATLLKKFSVGSRTELVRAVS